MKYILLILASLAILSVGAMADVLTPAATISFTPGATLSGGQVKLYTLVPAQAESINGIGAGVQIGTSVRLEITTSGTSSYTITFNSNFTSIGTLETGTTSGVVYVLEFLWDGTNFVEAAPRVRQGSPTVTVPVVATTSTLPVAEGVVLYTFTPTAAVNLASSAVARAGAIFDLMLVSDSTGRTVTFTTGFKSTGTLASGASTNVMIRFVSDGTNWRETSRVTGQTP